MRKKVARKSIIKSSKSIRTFLQQRMNELSLTPAFVVKDAKDRGIKIDSASFSKYLHKEESSGGLPEESILFLAIRWGININLIVGTATISDGKLKVSLPKYDEAKALKQLKTIFG